MSEAHGHWVRVCAELGVARAEEGWRSLVEWSASNASWHSLDNCISYQIKVWRNMLLKGVEPVTRPELFEFALLVRHLPPDRITLMLSDVLPKTADEEQRDAYLVGLLLEGGARPTPAEDNTESDQTLFLKMFKRDMQIFEDLELAVLGAPRDTYLQHAALIRDEYPNLHYKHYLELRLKVLEQFLRIPKLFHTDEFSDMESSARENLDVEIHNIRKELDRTDADWKEN